MANRPVKKLWEIYDITSSKRVFQSEWKSTWVPFYRAREIVKLAKNWYVDNELYISEEMYNEYSKKYWIPKENDIMVTWVGTIWICYFVKKDDKFYFKDGNIIWFKSQDKTVDSRFIEYAFKSNNILNQINNNPGSVVATLTIEKAKEIQIPLPPLDIQKTIVAKLDETFAQIDEAITTTQINIQSTEEFTKSILDKVFEEWEWEEKKLDKVCEFYNEWILPLEDEEYNYIWLENIESNTWKLVDFKPSFWKNIKSNKVIFKQDMVLYGKLRPYLNKVHIAQFDGIATTEILPLKCLENISPQFLAHYLKTEKFVNLANSNISWARMPRVTTKFLKEEIFIPIPPLAEQSKIVTYLDQVFIQSSELKSQYQAKITELKELKASILQSAFEGKLV